MLASQPPTEILAELTEVRKKHPNPKKNRAFFGKGFLFSVVISPLKKSPPLLLKKIRIFDKKKIPPKNSRSPKYLVGPELLFYFSLKT